MRRYLLNVGHHSAIGHPAAIHPGGFYASGSQCLMYLRANAEHHYQAHT